MLPALTLQPPANEATRHLLALASRLGGMGIVNPMALPSTHRRASQEITKPLVTIILQQHGDVLQQQFHQHVIKHRLHNLQRKELSAEAAAVISSLPNSLQRCASAGQEKGVSSWLAAVPLARQARRP